MNQLWTEYMSRKQSRVTEASVVTRLESPDASTKLVLLKADFHFAEVSVSHSTNPSLVGISGFVVRDNKHTLHILSQDERVRSVSKNESVFDFGFKNNVIRIYGNSLAGRPEDRWRSKHTLQNTFTRNEHLIRLD